MERWTMNGIDLTAICEAADWHLATAIDGMMAETLEITARGRAVASEIEAALAS